MKIVGWIHETRARWAYRIIARFLKRRGWTTLREDEHGGLYASPEEKKKAVEEKDEGQLDLPGFGRVKRW